MLGTKLRSSTRTVCSLHLPRARQTLLPHTSFFPCTPCGFWRGNFGPHACKSGRYFVTKSSSRPRYPTLPHCNMMLSSANTRGCIHNLGQRKDRPGSVTCSHHDHTAGRWSLPPLSNIPKQVLSHTHSSRKRCKFKVCRMAMASTEHTWLLCHH